MAKQKEKKTGVTSKHFLYFTRCNCLSFTYKVMYVEGGTFSSQTSNPVRHCYDTTELETPKQIGVEEQRQRCAEKQTSLKQATQTQRVAPALRLSFAWGLM
eukprot:GHVL01038034.1.p1 GENE.GHVL01038034.1~~GHVL01038034.1.p1  ORF type:complete len:101 (-),score=8.02 GHVL01038034.1:229-531(-)